MLRHLPLQLPRRTRNSPTADVARRSAPRCAFHRDQLRAVHRACRRAPQNHSRPLRVRSEEHTSELQSLMPTSHAASPPTNTPPPPPPPTPPPPHPPPPPP